MIEEIVFECGYFLVETPTNAPGGSCLTVSYDGPNVTTTCPAGGGGATDYAFLG